VTRISGSFAARLCTFADIRSLLEEFGRSAALDTEDCLRLTLIVEELFTNTVRHGHGGDCDAPVDVTLTAETTQVVLTYQDSAPQYDPLTAARRADLSSPLETRAVGGLGMLLTVAMSLQATYSYVEGRNRVELTLRRSRSG
jgi:anti-sigma regulatory factor (Ser/Thr protein kinase)